MVIGTEKGKARQRKIRETEQLLELKAKFFLILICFKVCFLLLVQTADLMGLSF